MSGNSVSVEERNLTLDRSLEELPLVALNDGDGVAAGEADKARFVETQYARHGQRIFHLCLRLGCGNVAWAEDMTHETFIRLLERSDSIDPAANVGGWLTTVAYRLCLDRAKREQSVWGKVQRLLAVEPPQRPNLSPERAVLADEQGRAAMTAIAKLPEKERAAVLMRFVDQLEQREIASVMGHSEGYVSKLLARATRVLRAEGWELADG